MAHVGVQRLTTRHAQHHCAQNDEGGARVVPHEAQRIVRAHGPQHRRVVHDVRNTQHRNGGKPHQRDGTEELADVGRAALLHGKQHEQNDQGQRNHRLLEGRRHHLKTFHRRQHRNGRGNDAIAVKQASAKNAHHQQHPAQLRLVFDRLRRQGQHGHQTAFAMVIGPQHQGHVLERDDDRQGPEEDRENAQHVAGCERHVARTKHLFDRVQHAGADIAINHTDGAHGERSERRFG